MEKRHFRSLALALAATTALGACSITEEMREITADRIARPAFLSERVISAGDFNLTAWERINKAYEPVNLYIEGDGIAWVSRSEFSLDPTPSDPVALNLAAMDHAANVAYLARPCQYSKLSSAGPCPHTYWTDGRFAPEVIASYHAALDNMKHMYEVTGFHLIGYSGGAGIAALVAAERDDILSIRTVAGNLDHETFTNMHDVSPMKASLNPVSVAPQLAGLPQHHFIGGNDRVITPAIFHSWRQSSGETDCVHYTLIPENEHDDGWAEKWPELLKMELTCEGPPAPAPAPVPMEFIDVKKTPGKP